jgi:hypothetical protein
VARQGLDGLLFTHSGFPVDGFILNPDFTVTRISTSTPYAGPDPDGMWGGLRFKNRIISLGSWYFTKPAASGTWERGVLYPADNFVPPYPTVWPITTYSSDYTPTARHAATADRFVMLSPDSFNPGRNLIVTSDDGLKFTVQAWTGPIPLPEVTFVAGSPTSFLAIATGGRVLVSTDGLQWTVHPVSPGLEISSVLRFNGKWHAVGNNGTTATAVWSSSDGITWSRSA